MKRSPLSLVFAVALALTASAASADEVDAMGSADCRRALESLQAQEAVVIAARRAAESLAPAGASSALDALRRQAARACLGGTGEPPPPKQIALPPITVSPIVVPRFAPSPPPAPVTAAPRRIEPSVWITSCEAGSCRASDGTVLMRAGPLLVGPRGVCRGTQGMPLECP